MADTSFASASRVQKWRKQYFLEYTRESRLARFTSPSPFAPIFMTEELGGSQGMIINIGMLLALDGAAVENDNTLRGNEESVDNYNLQATCTQYRKAVSMGEYERGRGPDDIMGSTVRSMLVDWSARHLRDRLLDVIFSCNVDGVTAYASCSEAEKDAYLTANDGTVSRFLFGNALGNQSGTDHSASLSAVDSTNDTLDTGIVSLLRRMAEGADPALKPYKVKGNMEGYVLLCQRYAFRDLAADSTMVQANRDARMRGVDNPLFALGDLLWENILCVNVPEIAVLSNVGASGTTDVAPCALLGAQAAAVAWKRRPEPIKHMDDYDNLLGKGIRETRAQIQGIWNSISMGLIHCYVSGVADS